MTEQQKYAEVRQLCEAAGLYHTETGGHCTAWVKDGPVQPDGYGYWSVVLTQVEEPSEPTDADEPCWLGIYPTYESFQSPTEHNVKTYPSLQAALAALEESENKAAMSVRDLVLDMTGDGTCEQLGDVQGFGWYGLVLFSARDLESYPQLAPHKAAIVSEDNYGFKEVGLFESVAKAQEIWYDLEHECAKYDADLDSHL